MEFEKFTKTPKHCSFENWQLGSKIEPNFVEQGIALLFIADYRGVLDKKTTANTDSIRKELYKLSADKFKIPICDLGDLISGIRIEDSHSLLEEVISYCHFHNTIPIVVGGGLDFAFPLSSALSFHQKNNALVMISEQIPLNENGDPIDNDNVLYKILKNKQISIKNYTHLGLQTHLKNDNYYNLLKDIDIEIVRLASMTNNIPSIEPYFRQCDSVIVNCDAIESFSDDFSIHPHVNGLNRREICACMKEIGLGKKLKSVGIFNFNMESTNQFNHQLLAQMMWYAIDGMNIQYTHPQKHQYETYLVLLDDIEYTFKKEVFSNLWYFGKDEAIENCLPCTQQDYENMKKGMISIRFTKFHQ